MRDVIDQLEGWWKNGETAALATVVGTFRSAPRQPGASMLVGPAGEAVGSVSGGCVEGAVYELGEQVLRDGRPVLQRYGVSDDDAFAVGLTCGGILDIFVEKVNPETYAQLPAVADACAPSRRSPSPRSCRAPRSGWASGWWSGPTRSTAAPAPARLDDAIRDDARGLLDVGAQRDGDLRRRRPAPRRGPLGVRRVVRAAAPHDRLRGHRLRRRLREDRLVPRLPGHGVRRAAGVRHGVAVPGGQRGGRRVAAPLPRRRGRGRAHRQAHGAVHPHPRPEVRRAAAGGGAAAAGGGLHRGDGVAAHPRRPAGAAARARGHRRGDRAHVVADRARPRRTHPGGDGRVDRRGDDRAALGRRRAPGSPSARARSTWRN